MNHTLQDIIGARIQSVHLNANKTILVIVTDRGDYAWETEGDCCSNSWIEHFSGVHALVGQVLGAVEAKDTFYPSDGELKVYAFTFQTPQGHATLEMRNASNGYYGGWLEAIKTPNPLPPNVTEDF